MVLNRNKNEGYVVVVFFGFVGIFLVLEGAYWRLVAGLSILADPV